MKIAQTIGTIGEFGLIERIRRAAPRGTLRLGIGDDCAAQALAPGELLLTTTDMLIEEIHFRREWTDLRRLGRKSVSVNVSDIAAMGGEPRALFLGLALPSSMTVEEIDEFAAGFLEAAADYGAILAGGDTCRSPGPLLVSVTAEGAVPETQLVSRAGARLGDLLYVSGTLGDSALALRHLKNGQVPPPELAERHHDPRARTALGRALAQGGLASAMIDLSDGLLADLGHILEASAVGAQVDQESLPLSAAFRAALADAPDLMELALGGGEDYELLFCAAPQHEKEVAALSEALAIPLTRVGEIHPLSEGLSLRYGASRIRPPGSRGFSHFEER
jgi:thiamine-monophosphate kinase